MYCLAAITSAGEVLLGDEWVGDCDAIYDTCLREALTEDADVLGGWGATVVFTTTPLTAIAALGDSAFNGRTATYEAVTAPAPRASPTEAPAHTARRRRRYSRRMKAGAWGSRCAWRSGSMAK